MVDSKLLDDVLNEISNYESAGASENKPSEARAQDDQMKDLLQEMNESFGDDMIRNLAEEDFADVIENVLGELMSKEVLYEPFVCMKQKIELELESGNRRNEKALDLIKQILFLLDQGKMSKEQNEKLMQHIFELQELGEIWQEIGGAME